jgi:hypothetical protein
MKKNKLDIPLGFLADRKRAIGSTLFEFNDYLSLSSYVPKKNKAFVLLSSVGILPTTILPLSLRR